MHGYDVARCNDSKFILWYMHSLTQGFACCLLLLGELLQELADICLYYLLLCYTFNAIDEVLSKLGRLSTQALVDGLWVMGYPPAQIAECRPLHPR